MDFRTRVEDALRKHLNLGDRIVNIVKSENGVIVDFVNLPAGPKYTWFDTENNRFVVSINSERRTQVPLNPWKIPRHRSTEGKVQLEFLRSNLAGGDRKWWLRGGTGELKTISKRLAVHLNKIAKEVPPELPPAHRAGGSKTEAWIGLVEAGGMKITNDMAVSLMRVAAGERVTAGSDMVARLLDAGLIEFDTYKDEPTLTRQGKDAVAVYATKVEKAKAKRRAYSRGRHSALTGVGMTRTRSGSYENKEAGGLRSTISALRDTLHESSRKE